MVDLKTVCAIFHTNELERRGRARKDMKAIFELPYPPQTWKGVVELQGP
jgi:hypothetical protein